MQMMTFIEQMEITQRKKRGSTKNNVSSDIDAMAFLNSLPKTEVNKKGLNKIINRERQKIYEERQATSSI